MLICGAPHPEGGSGSYTGVTLSGFERSLNTVSDNDSNDQRSETHSPAMTILRTLLVYWRWPPPLPAPPALNSTVPGHQPWAQSRSLTSTATWNRYKPMSMATWCRWKG